MGAVAAGLKRKGFLISGSDEKVYPPMSTFLEAEGVELRAGYRPENLPEEAELVVVGNALSRGNEELEAVLDRKLRYLSLPETLKEFFLRGKRNLVVTGTHGKTTTTSILTHLLEEAGRDPSYLIGGVPRNLAGGARFTDSDFFVLEGDEYDTAFFDKRSKFLHYLPELVIINNIEFDHADIYEDLEAIKLTFRRLVNLIPRSGRLFINGDDPSCLEVAERSLAPVSKIGLGPENDLRIEALVFQAEGTSFRLEGESYFSPLFGEFNARNVAMAITTARAAGLSAEEIRAGLRSFQGVKRRQELRGEVNGVKVIDDFAHHPTAIRECLHAIRQRFQAGRLWAIFEPRSNTMRRKIFEADLAESLAGADGVIISAVENPEKVQAEDRLQPERVVERLASLGKAAFYAEDVEAIVSYLKKESRSGDVVAVFSNGGFGGLHEKLLSELGS